MTVVGVPDGALRRRLEPELLTPYGVTASEIFERQLKGNLDSPNSQELLSTGSIADQTITSGKVFTVWGMNYFVNGTDPTSQISVEISIKPETSANPKLFEMNIRTFTSIQLNDSMVFPVPISVPDTFEFQINPTDGGSTNFRCGVVFNFFENEAHP